MQHSKEKPYKVWSGDRELRKSVIASDLLELKSKGAHKLGYESCQIENLRLVLESDGTEVEDERYFQMASKETIFLLLKPDERWLPAGVEALKSAINGFPGNITVVLHLDNKEPPIVIKRSEPPWKLQVVPVDGNTAQKATSSAVFTQKNGVTTSQATASSRADFIMNALKTKSSIDNDQLIKTSLPKHETTKYGLEEDEDEEDEEEDESDTVRTSPVHDHSKCDFHCSALHKGATQIRAARSVATSPIQEGALTISVPVFDNLAGPRRTTAKSIQHVRFVDTDLKRASNNSEDSETESTEQDEQLTERYLLLVDHLSVEQDRHLTLKDIGIILERLNSKIVDVDRLERDRESQDCYNWIIKATVKGEVLREIGVIYNGQYYGIMEHPGYF